MNSKLISRLKLAGVSAVAMLLISSLSFAATRTWDGGPGGTDNNWSTPANWSQDTTPESGDLVIFDGTSSKLSIIDSLFPAKISGITVSNASQVISLQTDLTVNGNMAITAGVISADSYYMSITGEVALSGSGTLDAGAGMTTIEGAFSNSGRLIAGSGSVYFKSNFTNSGIINAAASTIFFYGGLSQTLTPGNAIFPTIVVNKSAAALSASGILKITGTLSLSAGVFNAPSLTLISGDFIKNSAAVFNHSSGTVEIIDNSAVSCITGSPVFYSLVCTAENKSISFETGSLTTVEGMFKICGSAGNLIKLSSTLESIVWKINPSGPRSITFVDVVNSININASNIICANSKDGGNNTGWFSFLAPGNFSVSPHSTNALKYQWNDYSEGSGLFRILEGNLEKVLVEAETLTTIETGLDTNTQYTREVEVYTVSGTRATSESISRYTSIEAISGATYEVSQTTINVWSANEPSHLDSGSSGIYFSATREGGGYARNSSWIKNNNWSISALIPSKKYIFSIQIKNGESVEAQGLYGLIKYTLAVTPSAQAYGSFSSSASLKNHIVATISSNTNAAGTLYSVAVSSEEGIWKYLSSTLGASTSLEPVWTANALTWKYTLRPTNESYQVKAFAKNGDGVVTDASATVSAFTPPQKPAGLSCYQTTASTAALTWDAAPGATRYEVLMGTTAFSQDILNGKTVLQNYFTQEGLTESTAYYWRVRAYNNSTGETSDVVSFETNFARPNTPEITAVSKTALLVSWTDKYSTELGYRLLNGSGVVTAEYPADTKSTIESGLSTNTPYTYSIQVFHTSGAMTSDAATKYTSVESVSGVSFEGLTCSSVTLHATAEPSNLSLGSTGFCFYNITKNQNSSWTKTNSWTSSGLLPNYLYNFSAQSRNGDGVSTTPYNVSKYTLATTGAISKLTGAWSRTDQNHIDIIINSNGNSANTKYALTIDNGDTWLKPTGSSTTSAYWDTATSWTYAALTADAVYNFRVKALNGENIETTPSATFAASSPPDKISTIAIKELSASSATVSWDSVPGASAYNISFGFGESSDNIYRVNSIASTEYIFAGLSSGTKYSMQISPVKDLSRSDEPAEILSSVAQGVLTASATGEPSSIFSFTTTVLMSCEIVPKSTFAVEVRWNDFSADETLYSIEKSLDGIAYDEIAAVSPNTTKYTGDGTTGLIPNTRYWFRVRAKSGSVFSDYATATSRYTWAQAPAASDFGAKTGKSITVNWSGGLNSSATQYFCENINTGNNSGWITAISWRDTMLSPESEYTYRVKAKSAEGIETVYLNLGNTETELIHSLVDLSADGSKLLSSDIIRSSPKLSATFPDNIVSSSILFFVDEVEVTDGLRGNFDEMITGSGLATFEFTPKAPLAYGFHKIKVSGLDSEEIVYETERISLQVSDLAAIPSIVGKTYFYPNPYNPSNGDLKITYTLALDADISLFIFSLDSSLVWEHSCLSGSMGGKAGYNEISWNGVSMFGSALSNGAYIVRAMNKATGMVLSTSKFMVLK